MRGLNVATGQVGLDGPLLRFYCGKVYGETPYSYCKCWIENRVCAARFSICSGFSSAISADFNTTLRQWTALLSSFIMIDGMINGA